MIAEAFKRLVEELRQGDESGLDQLFVTHYFYLTNWLQKQHRCSEVDAKDVCMDVFLKFRAALLKGNITNDNIRGYLVTIAKNEWLRRQQKEKLLVAFDIDKIDYHLGQKEGFYHEKFNPMIKSEAAKDFEIKDQKQAEAYKWALEKLGESCKRLIQAFYIDRMRLTDLQTHLGYGSYDSIKTMRRKCFNQLKKWSLHYLENNKK